MNATKNPLAISFEAMKPIVEKAMATGTVAMELHAKVIERHFTHFLQKVTTVRRNALTGKKHVTDMHATYELTDVALQEARALVLSTSLLNQALKFRHETDRNEDLVVVLETKSGGGKKRIYTLRAYHKTLSPTEFQVKDKFAEANDRFPHAIRTLVRLRESAEKNGGMERRLINPERNIRNGETPEVQLMELMMDTWMYRAVVTQVFGGNSHGWAYSEGIPQPVFCSVGGEKCVMILSWGNDVVDPLIAQGDYITRASLECMQEDIRQKVEADLAQRSQGK